MGGVLSYTPFSAIIGNKELVICFPLSFHLMETFPSPEGLKGSLRRRFYLQLPFVSEMSSYWRNTRVHGPASS